MPGKIDLDAKLKDKRYGGIVWSLVRFGLTSHLIAYLYGDGDVEKRQVNYAFKSLMNDRVIEQVDSDGVSAGPGRPEKAYRLTMKGVKALQSLGHKHVKFLDLDGAKDVSHRLSMALVAASIPGAEIEKVISYGQRHMRADVYFIAHSAPRIVEVEQHLSANHKDRATEKIKGYVELFESNPQHLSHEMLVVFNISKDEKATRQEKERETLNTWRLALRDVGNVSFPIYYATLQYFMDDYAPNTPTVDNKCFTLLTPSTRRQRTQVSEPATEYPAMRVVPMTSIHQTAKEIAVGIEPVDDAEDQDRFFHLGEAANAIYRLDFNEVRGRTKKYSVEPQTSLEALRAFLHHPVMVPFLGKLKTHVADFEQRVGITQQRLAASRLAWAFLGYFGFGRGGLLKLKIYAPEMGVEQANEVSFELTLPKDNDFERIESEQKKNDYLVAISWILNALLLYPDKLDLVSQKTRRTTK